MRRLLTSWYVRLAMAVVVAAAGVVIGVEVASGHRSGAQPVTPSCAWPAATNAQTLAENSLVNISNPDTASDYWLMPFTVQDGLTITLSGRYPESRYMSFAVYDSHGAPFSANGVASTLTDYRITPDPGSVNPWQHRARPGGRFTVTLRADVKAGETNTLPLAPAATPPGATGLIFLRVYAAAKGPASVPLPATTFTLNGVSRHLHTCPLTAFPSGHAVAQILSVLGLPPTFARHPTPAKAPPPARPGAPGVLVPFARAPEGPGGTVDTDTGYLAALFFPPQNGDVLVIRARAPTTPSGAVPRPWPDPQVDMRYWSLCDDLNPFPTPVVVNHLPNGKVDEGCRYDSQIRVDQAGDYTIVVGAESERAAIERIPGVTFIPLSTADPTQLHKLNLRNMLSSPGFSHAIQDVPANGSAQAAAAVMGPYYPRAAFCTLAQVMGGRCDA